MIYNIYHSKSSDLKIQTEIYQKQNVRLIENGQIFVLSHDKLFYEKNSGRFIRAFCSDPVLSN